MVMPPDDLFVSIFGGFFPLLSHRLMALTVPQASRLSDTRVCVNGSVVLRQQQLVQQGPKRSRHLGTEMGTAHCRQWVL